MYTFISFLVLIMLSSSDSKHFTRCGLVVELLKQGFPSDLLRDWVCLIEAESSRRTEVVGGPEHDGSMEYGLFQIDDKYWCTKGKPGNGCNVRCKDLLADDITKSCQCAQKIFSLQGFRAWYGWLNKCYNKQLPDISKGLIVPKGSADLGE